MDGGPPVDLANGSIWMCSKAISADGKSFAYSRYEGEGKDQKFFLIVQKLSENGSSLKLESPDGVDHGSVGWAPDGKALSFLRYNDLWIQPLAGGTPVRLTHFGSKPYPIVNYAWSRDGRKIAITRALFYDTDAVQFRGFH